MPGQSGTTYTYSCPLTEKRNVNFQIYRILKKNLVKKATLKLVEFGLVGKKRTLAFRKCLGCYLQFCIRKKLWAVLKIWWLKWSYYIQSETFKGLKGKCHDIQWFFALFLREHKMAAARASVADISAVSRANSFTAKAVSSKCHFPRSIVVFRGLPLWPPLFFPTQNGCQKSPITVTLPL